MGNDCLLTIPMDVTIMVGDILDINLGVNIYVPPKMVALVILNPPPLEEEIVNQLACITGNMYCKLIFIRIKYNNARVY